MNGKNGFTLVEMMIVVVIIALIAAVAVPNALRSRINANESAAQASLRAIASALETYSTLNNMRYPTDANDLLTQNPPYLNQNFFDDYYNGYTFDATLTTASYSITASPRTANHGTKSYTVSTGAVLVTNP